MKNQISSITLLDSKSIIRIDGKDMFETSLDIAKYFAGSIECAASGNKFPLEVAKSVYVNPPILGIGGDNVITSKEATFKTKSLGEKLSKKYPSSTFAIGDCGGSATIRNAVSSAFTTAVEI